MASFIILLEIGIEKAMMRQLIESYELVAHFY